MATGDLNFYWNVPVRRFFRVFFFNEILVIRVWQPPVFSPTAFWQEEGVYKSFMARRLRPFPWRLVACLGCGEAKCAWALSAGF